MVVKDKVGRRRYIIVNNSESLKNLFIELKKIDSFSKIIKQTGGYSIVRCHHRYRDKIIAVLNENGVKTYRTTGTIRKALRIIRSI